jgi:hypothetical protein
LLWADVLPGFGESQMTASPHYFSRPGCSGAGLSVSPELSSLGPPELGNFGDKGQSARLAEGQAFGDRVLSGQTTVVLLQTHPGPMSDLTTITAFAAASVTVEF